MRKAAYVSLALAGLLVASGVTFRLVTGKCPIGCIMHEIKGDKPANAS
ncbi:MAG TPA: hypothetical protein VFF73_16760 [Planctomycetota bacterium]|nr:hypothetical protein [Planctomycetota bacterium]